MLYLFYLDLSTHLGTGNHEKYHPSGGRRSSRRKKLNDGCILTVIYANWPLGRNNIKTMEQSVVLGAKFGVIIVAACSNFTVDVRNMNHGGNRLGGCYAERYFVSGCTLWVVGGKIDWVPHRD